MDLSSFTDVLILILFSVLLILIFFGQNWRHWISNRQMNKSVRELSDWRKLGISLFKKKTQHFHSKSLSDSEIDRFIDRMIEFFVIAPSKIDPPVFPKLRFLSEQKNRGIYKLLNKFFPNIPENEISTIISLLNATSEINNIYKEVKHLFIISKKTHSNFTVEQNAIKIIELHSKAAAYRHALDSFQKQNPIGDSVGPMAVMYFMGEINGSKDTENSTVEVKNMKSLKFLKYSGMYNHRSFIVLRAPGPTSSVGNPGIVLKTVIDDLTKQSKKIKLILTIDASMRLHGERTGNIRHGIGIAVGDQDNFPIEKFQIESLALNHNPPILIESIICKQKLSEAISPMNEAIKNSVPEIARLMKQIIRSQTEEGDCVVILGIGNGIGVKNELQSH